MKQLLAVFLFAIGTVLNGLGTLFMHLTFGLTFPWPLPLLAFWFLFSRPFADGRDYIAALLCFLILLGFPMMYWGKVLRNKARTSVGQTHLNE
jgi:hypothetical protein